MKFGKMICLYEDDYIIFAFLKTETSSEEEVKER